MSNDPQMPVGVPGARALVARAARRAKLALLSPQPETYHIDLLRTFLLKRRVFDVLSLWMQLRDLRRLAKIPRNTPKLDAYKSDVFSYNFSVTWDKTITKTRRMEKMFRIVAAVRRDLSPETVLCVGPRNVQELLVAWLYGFAWRNVHGIDLYSTNPKIQVMDMENMTFADESFDVLIMSSTLSYASDTERCIREVARVLKPAGSFCFTAAYCPSASRFHGNSVSGAEIAEYLKEAGFELRFYEPKDKINMAGLLQTSHTICVNKADPSAPVYDRIDVPWQRV